jgi:hypothetical protein
MNRQPDSERMILKYNVGKYDTADFLTAEPYRDPPIPYTNLTHRWLDILHGDDDSDGMPNNFENYYGLNKDDPADTSGDTDNDGSTNIEEFRLGTDPGMLTVISQGLRDRASEASGLLCYPNPFNPSLNIRFDKPPDAVNIFDVHGRQVGSLRTRGRRAVTWNASDVPAGVYIISARYGHDHRLTRRVLLVK